MPGETTIQESPIAGKGGEPTAAAPSAASERTTVDPKNLTPAGVASLIGSAFAEPPGTPPKPEGQEVQPAGNKGGGDKTPEKEPEWTPDQQAWFELRSKATTEQEIAEADAQAPEFSEEQRQWIEKANAENGNAETLKTELPGAVLEQVKAWEDAGGALPPALQAIVDKRIGREVGKVKELEKRATDAEAEVARLTGELQARGTVQPVPGGLDEKSLNATIETCKKFQKDARAVLGGYGTAEQKARLEKHMADSNLDENGVRAALDEVNEWLTEQVPQLRQRVQTFRATEAKVEPIVTARFATLADKNSEAAKWSAEIAQLVPELAQRTPAHKLAVGVYALGKVAWDHLSKASADGDVIAALQEVLSKHVPLPVNGNGHANGKSKFFLPGKPPVKAPTGGRGFIAPRVDARKGEEEAASARLRENPTAANVTESLKIALR